MYTDDFVHLHTHSEYSLLDGACKLEELAKKTKELKMSAIALTEHGNMFSAIKFYKQMMGKGIKPIIGMEAYLSPTRCSEKNKIQGVPTYTHLTLLVQNNEGLQNLMQLATLGYREGFYYKPRIDNYYLSSYAKGLICLSGCLGSEVNRLLLMGDMEKAIKTAGLHREMFGKDNYYLEIMNHNLKDQVNLIPHIIELSKKTDIPLVASNDVHYINKEDAGFHEVLMCVATGARLDDVKRKRMGTNEFYLKSKEEMYSIFKDIPECLRNTVKIADMCKVYIPFGENHVPDFLPPNGQSPEDYLIKLCYEGIKKRNIQMTENIEKRLKYELEIITSKGFSGYFLIVHDFVKFAKENEIPVGPGRGSAAGSLVSYLLGITTINPLDYNLLFERFLNPGRTEMPDIDIDICTEGREQVIDYVRNKYGNNNVSQLITYSTMKGRAVIRDVGRVLGIPLSEVNKISQKLPAGNTNIKLNTLIKNDPEIKKIANSSPEYKKLFNYASKLEGMLRHVSKHAGGVVIADKPLTEYVPLAVIGGVETTQYDMNDLPKLGILKMDLLGLKTLTLINKVKKIIYEQHKINIDIENIPLDDYETYEMLSRGEGVGLFQLDATKSIRELAQKLKPSKFEDVIALIALHRPGPLQSGMVEQYIKRKHGLEKVEYIHKALKDILQNTQGVILYQEQVMSIARKIGNFTPEDADLLRKAMGKKIVGILNSFREQFIKGAIENGLNQNTAGEIFSLMEHFGGYGFNKSHSTAYAFNSYATAYLKSKYPIEFMTALLSIESNNNNKKDNMIKYVTECKRLNIELLPPDVNKSMETFAIEGDKIRFGFRDIKGIGESPAKHIVEVRKTEGEFINIQDFARKIDRQFVDKRVLEALVKSGAIDSLNIKRSECFDYINTIIKISETTEKEKKSNQISLFGDSQSSIDLYPEPKEIPEWGKDQKLEYEKESFGFYLSGLPIFKYQSIIEGISKYSSKDLELCPDRTTVILGGIISSVKITIVKTGKSAGKKMAKFILQDFDGKIDVVMFPRTYKKYVKYIEDDNILFIKGKLDRKESIEIIGGEVYSIQEGMQKFCKNVCIKGATLGLTEDIIGALKEICLSHAGNRPLFFELTMSNKKRALIKAENEFSVTPSTEFIAEVEEVIGKNNIAFNIF